MKIGYISLIRMPTEKAHGIQIFETCHGLARHCESLILYITKTQSKSDSTIEQYYGKKLNFKISRVFDFLSLNRLGRFGFVLRSLVFSFLALVRAKRDQISLVYTRDEFVPILCRLFSVKCIYEIHDIRLGLIQKKAIKLSNKIVTISKALEDEVKLVDSNKAILVAPDGVDIKRFREAISGSSYIPNLPQGKIVMYIGHLYEWKGAHLLAQIAGKMSDLSFVFIGGTKHDIVEFKRKYNSSNIYLLGHIPINYIPLYQSRASILVLPNSGKEKISRLYTSPRKGQGIRHRDRVLRVMDMDLVKMVVDFIESSRRILTVSKKPSGKEYSEMAKITGLGIIVIGVLGFIVLFVFALLKIGV
jgi:protein translocase SEC61 complex gamma subunit